MFLLTSSTRPERVYTAIFTVALAIKVVIAVLEAQKKTRWLRWNKDDHSPEETCGVYSLGLYSWLNQLALEGYQKILR